MTIKNWQWPPSKISFKDLFLEYGCDGSSDTGSADINLNYNELVTLSQTAFTTGVAVSFTIVNGKPNDNFKYSFDPLNTISPSLNSVTETLDTAGTKTIGPVAGTLTPGQYELTVYFIETGNTRKIPLIVQNPPTSTTTTLNPSVYNPTADLFSDNRTLVHNSVPGSAINYFTSNEFNENVRFRIQYGPPNAQFTITINDPNNQKVFVTENLLYNGYYISDYITLGVLGVYNFEVEFTDGTFSGTVINGRIRRVSTTVSLPVILYNETIVLSPSYWTVGNTSSLRIFGGKTLTGFKYSIDPPSTSNPSFGTVVYFLDADGKYLNSSFGTGLAVGNYDLNLYFLGTTNIRKFSFSVAAAQVTNQSGLWSIQALPQGETSYVPASPDLPSPFTNTIARLFNEGDTITFRITAPKTYTHWWKNLGVQYGVATGTPLLGAGPTPPTYTITQGHEVYFGLGQPISKPKYSRLVAFSSVNFVLTATCNGALNEITASGFTGGSGEYQVAVKTGTSDGLWFTSEAQALNPYSLQGGSWNSNTFVTTKTGLPDGTYWFAARDLHNFNNVITKSIVVNCSSGCVTDHSLSIWETDIDVNACVPLPVTITNPYPVDACTDAVLKNIMKVKLSTPTQDGMGYYGDATIKFTADLVSDTNQFAAPFVDDPQLYQAAKLTYNTIAYRRLLTWGNILIENSSTLSSGSGTLTSTDRYYEMTELPETEVYLIFRLIGGGGAGGAADMAPGEREISMGGRGGHGGVVHGIVKLPATPGNKKKLLGGIGVNGGDRSTIATGFGFSSSTNFQAHGALGASYGDAGGISGIGGQGGGATSIAYQVGSTIIPIATAGGGGGGGGASYRIQSEWVKSGKLSASYGTFLSTYGISTRLVNTVGTFTFQDLFYAKAGVYRITFSGDNNYTIVLDGITLPTVNNNFASSNLHTMVLPTSGDKIIDVTLTNVASNSADNPNSIAITVEYLGAVDLNGVSSSFVPQMIWTTLDFAAAASVGRPQTTNRIIDVYTNADLNGTQGIRPASDGGGGGGGGGNQGQGGLGGQDLAWNPGVSVVSQGGTNGRASKNTTVVLNNSNWIFFDYIQPRLMTTNQYGNANFYGSGGLFYDTNQFLDSAGIHTRTTPGAPGALSFYYTTDISNIIGSFNSSNLKISRLPDIPVPTATISFKDVSSTDIDALLILYVDGSAKYTFDVWDRWSSLLNNGIGNQYEFKVDYVSGDSSYFNAGNPRDFRGRPISQAPSATNAWVNFDGKTMLYWRANFGSSHTVNISVRRRSDGFLVVTNKRISIISSQSNVDGTNVSGGYQIYGK